MEKPTNPPLGSFKHTITVNNKRYKYVITPINKKWVFFECPTGGISQRFLAEDIMALLIDLPELILSEIDYKRKQEEVIRFRISSEQKNTIEKNAIKNGYNNVSAFIRDLALAA